MNIPRIPLTEEDDEQNTDQNQAKEVVESFHRGSIDTLPDHPLSLLESLGIDADGNCEEMVYSFHFAYFPDQDEFDANFLSGIVSDGRVAKLEDGAVPTKKEIKMFRKAFAEDILAGEHFIDVNVYEAKGTRKSIFVALENVGGGYLNDWTVHKTLKAMIQYYEANGAIEY